MSILKIDPENYFKFDLSAGAMSYSKGGDRLIAFPVESLLGILGTGIDRIQRTVPYTVGLHLGSQCGDKLVEAFDGDIAEGDIAPEQFLDHLNAVFALHGLGTVSLETWGNIMLVEWFLDVASSGDTNLLEFQEGTLSGVLRSVSGEPFEVAAVDEYGEGARFIVGSASMVDWTKLWMGEGHGLGEIVDRLHAGRHLQNDQEAR